MGAFVSNKIYYDNDLTEIDSVADSAPHREIDLAIIKARKELEGKAKITIMIPPLIYGYNPKHRRLSIQIPTLTRWALKHGYASHAGKGLAVESNIHVMDLARGYVVWLHALEKTGSQDYLLSNPYFLCETTGDSEPSWKEVASVIAGGLVKAGEIKEPEPRDTPAELYKDAFGEYMGAVIGLNYRSRANRLREPGWKPVEKGWRESFLEDTGSFKGYKGTVAS